MIDIRRRSEKVHMTDEADIRLSQSKLGKKNDQINISLRMSIRSEVSFIKIYFPGCLTKD